MSNSPTANGCVVGEKRRLLLLVTDVGQGTLDHWLSPRQAHTNDHTDSTNMVPDDNGIKVAICVAVL